MSANYQAAAALLIAAGDNTPPVFEQISNYVLTSQQGRVTPRYFDILPDNRISMYGQMFLNFGISGPAELEKVGTIALSHSVTPHVDTRPQPPPPTPPPDPPGPDPCSIIVPDHIEYRYSNGPCQSLILTASQPRSMLVDNCASLTSLTSTVTAPDTAISLSRNPMLTTIDFSSLQTGSFSASFCSSLLAINLPAHLGDSGFTYGDFDIQKCQSLASLSVPLLHATWSLIIEQTALTTLLLPSLQATQDVIVISNNELLTSINFPQLVATRWALGSDMTYLEVSNNAALTVHCATPRATATRAYPV